ncbi:hypothetical protein [Psychrobacter sp. NPDC078501]|uniref:hypothetical protein n=1 Tax=Psychrobacter sp. NPDC078501 TaxID=3364495 RepID=UPI00384DD186
MGLGFEVTNDAGRKQVLDTHALLSFSETIVSNASNEGNLYRDPRHITAYRPINDSVMTVNYLVRQRHVLDDGQYHYLHRVQGYGAMYNFSEVLPTANDRFGLQVFNSLGTLVFSSEQKPLKILEIINIPDVRQVGTSVNGRTTHWRKNHGSVTAAVVLIRQPLWTSGSNFMTSGVSLRSGYLAMEETVEHRDSNAADRWIGNIYGLYALVVDVTNF